MTFPKQRIEQLIENSFARVMKFTGGESSRKILCALKDCIRQSTYAKDEINFILNITEVIFIDDERA